MRRNLKDHAAQLYVEVEDHPNMPEDLRTRLQAAAEWAYQRADE